MENRNYYDLLEISKKASPEVIEKAYKALVKKYHPDLYEGDKFEAEKILKKINEAYEVLSNSEKRAAYDSTLHDDSISKEDYDKLQQELYNLKQSQSQVNNRNQQSTSYNQQTNVQSTNFQKSTDNIKQQPNPSTYQSLKDLAYKKQSELEQERQRQLQAELEYQQQLEYARQKAYHDAYIQDLRNRGYKIRYKKSFKDYLAIFITIVILLIISFVAWQIPFIRNWLVDFYNNNEAIKFLVNLFSFKN